jgi:hypothetical protein
MNYLKRSLVFILTLGAIAAWGTKLEVIGNKRTDQRVVLVEIADLLKDNDISEDDLTEIRRRVWNLRLFSKVQVSGNSKKVVIEVEERWTTIPILKASGGGGTSYYALGTYDINTFGKYLEVGGQYENLNGLDAGVIWFRKPQFLADRNLKVGADIWSINRVRFFFNPDDGESNGAFTLERKRINTFLEYRWDNDFYNFGVQYDYQQDKTSDFGLTDELIADNNANGFTPDSESISRFHTLYFDIGRLNYKNYLMDGQRLSLKSSMVVVTAEETNTRSLNELTFQYFKLLPRQHNFAWQFKLRTNDFQNLQNLNYVGGFEEVRGYQDGQFFDNVTWQNNLEYRFDLFTKKHAVVQMALFTDQAKEGSSLNNLVQSEEEILLSSGVGVRLISPKIYRLVLRLDYAQTHTRSIQRGLSFGIQQFF